MNKESTGVDKADGKTVADRFEAATKREKAQSGNAAAIREALLEIRDMLRLHWCDHDDGLIFTIAENALSEPPRNCDVGTAEEQEVRFSAFCHEHRDGTCCEKCPLFQPWNPHCELRWAQMPYSESEAAQ